MADKIRGFVPCTPGEIVAEMQDDPTIEHNWIRYKDDLLIAVRNEEGGIDAWLCTIREEEHEGPPCDAKENATKGRPL